MVLYPVLLSQSWSTTVPNCMLVSGIAQSGKILALSHLSISCFVIRIFESRLYVENSKLCFRDMKIMSRRNGGD